MTTCRVLRSNSLTPTACSNCWMVAVSDDCVRNRRDAAWVKEPALATATKQRRCRSETFRIMGAMGGRGWLELRHAGGVVATQHVLGFFEVGQDVADLGPEVAADGTLEQVGGLVGVDVVGCGGFEMH